MPGAPRTPIPIQLADELRKFNPLLEGSNADFYEEVFRAWQRAAPRDRAHLAYLFPEPIRGLGFKLDGTREAGGAPAEVPAIRPDALPRIDCSLQDLKRNQAAWTAFRGHASKLPAAERVKWAITVAPHWWQDQDRAELVAVHRVTFSKLRPKE